MRGSLVLLAALMACSDSSGPPHAPVLTTQLSSAVDSINGVLVVTLNASNPTDTTERIVYLAPSVYAEVRLDGEWRAGFGPAGFVRTDTLVLTSGADTTLGVVDVLFTPYAVQSSLAPADLIGNESFAIPPGMYDVRACFTPSGPGAAACGNGLPFTLTP
jgi:hypothetical protein